MTRMSIPPGCPAGVVDAPEAKLNSEYSVNPSNYHYPNLSLASGATALGSVKPRHLIQLQTNPLPIQPTNSLTKARDVIMALQSVSI
jgi:hypothetical protein